MDNLAALEEPDALEILSELKKRHLNKKYYTNLGDSLIAVTPQQTDVESRREFQDGHDYCSQRPNPNLPPHVFATAHDVYTDMRWDNSPHCVLVSGSSCSGKRDVCHKVISQLFRESEKVRWNKSQVFAVLTKGLNVLERLTTYHESTASRESSTASVVVTLFFGQNGHIQSAAVKTFLIQAQAATLSELPDKHGCLGVFYDLIAALHTRQLGMENPNRRLQIDTFLGHLPTTHPSLAPQSRIALEQGSSRWHTFVQDLKYFLDQAGRSIIVCAEFTNILCGLLYLSTVMFHEDPQSKQIGVQNRGVFLLAADHLGVQDRLLFDALVQDCWAHDGPSLQQIYQSRQQLVMELYTRLVKWLEEQINQCLPPVIEDWASIDVALLPAFASPTDGSLHALCQNMAAERLQAFAVRSLMKRELDTCREEGLKVKDYKYLTCDDVVDLGLRPATGLLDQLEHLLQERTISDKTIVLSLKQDFKHIKSSVKSSDSNKKARVFYASKKIAPTTFAVFHSSGQVVYQVTPQFRRENRIVPNRNVESLLVSSSSSATLREVLQPVLAELADQTSPRQYFVTTYTKKQIDSLLAHLSYKIPHVINCLELYPQQDPLNDDSVIAQIKAAYIPELTRHKRFGFSHWMSLDAFLDRYQVVVLPARCSIADRRFACKTVLNKVDILHRGVVVGKSLVFLMYWHKNKLDTMLDNFTWKVTVVQARARGYLCRKHMRDEIVSRLRSREKRNTRKVALIQNNWNPIAAQRSVAEYELYENMIEKTRDRLDDLPSFAWGKIIYMEQGQQLAKVYAGELTFLITGSFEAFDGLEFGLGYFHNRDRVRETQYIIENLEQGVELRRDSDGSLMAKRRCTLPVVVKQRPGETPMSADLVKTRGQLPLGQDVKLFDMQEFRSLVTLELRKETFPKTKLLQRCVVALSFGSSPGPLLSTPCWVAIVNVTALSLLEDEAELKSMKQRIAELGLKDEEKEETKDKQDEAKRRRQRKRWSKSDHRQHWQKKDKSDRVIREELRRRGEKVSDHMRYSWEEKPASAAVINMDTLYETFRNEGSSLRTGETEEGSSHQWAKLDVTLRYASRQLLTLEP